MKYKRITAMVMASVMFFSLVTGCSNKNDTQTENYTILNSLKEDYAVNTEPYEYDLIIPPFTFSANRGGKWAEQYLGSVGINSANELKSQDVLMETLGYNDGNKIQSVVQNEAKHFQYIDKRGITTKLTVSTQFTPSVYSNPEGISFEFDGNTNDAVAAAVAFIENFTNVTISSDYCRDYNLNRKYYLDDKKYYEVKCSLSNIATSKLDCTIAKVDITYHGNEEGRAFKKGTYDGDLATGSIGKITQSYSPLDLSEMKLYGYMSKAAITEYLQSNNISTTLLSHSTVYTQLGQAMSMQNIYTIDSSADINISKIVDSYSYDPTNTGKEINEYFTVYFKDTPKMTEQRDFISLLFGISLEEATAIVRNGSGTVSISANSQLGEMTSIEDELASSELDDAPTTSDNTSSTDTVPQTDADKQNTPSANNEKTDYRSIFDSLRMSFDITRGIANITN